MKRILSVLLALVLMLGLLAGCTKPVGPVQPSESRPVYVDPGEIKEPVIELYQLYNPNGFDTFTAILSNPNPFDIDVAFDVVFYKNGKEVARSEDWFANSISPSRGSLIWGNWGIPKDAEVDDVRLEVTGLNASYAPAIEAKYKLAETTASQAFYDFVFEKAPQNVVVWFVLYNDNNGNGRLDAGEIVSCWLEESFAGDVKQRFSHDTDAWSYTNVEVYYNAY